MEIDAKVVSHTEGSAYSYTVVCKPTNVESATIVISSRFKELFEHFPIGSTVKLTHVV